MAGLVKGLFGTIGKFVIGLALLLGVLAFLGQGLTDASLESFSVTGLEEVSSEYFVFGGELVLDNPSLLPIPLGRVSYDLYHEGGERFSSGSLSAFVLRPGTSSTSFSERVEWVPTTGLAADLLLADEVWVTINGSARINLPLLRAVDIPFEDRFDVREYVTQFVDAPVDVVDDVPVDVVSDSSDTGSESVDDVVGSLI